MDATKTALETDQDLVVAETAREHIRKVFKRLFAKLEALARSPLPRIRPRVSLTTGALFVLSTLVLPLAINSCGEADGSGMSIVVGDSYWPSLTFFALDFSELPGRVFYITLLGCAVFALGFATSSLVASKVSTRTGFLKLLVAITGTVSFLVLADYCALVVVETLDRMLTALGIRDFEDKLGTLIIPFLIFLICLRCLAARSVKASLPIRLTFFLGGVASFLSLIVISVWLLAGLREFDLEPWVPGIVSILLYTLCPLLLWYRYGLWPGRNSAVEWLPVRRRLVWIYVPAVIGQFWAAHEAVTTGIWGLIPCLLGIHLITFGYLQLVREATAKQQVA